LLLVDWLFVEIISKINKRILKKPPEADPARSIDIVHHNPP